MLFRGENIRGLRWQGRHFEGNVFDPEHSHNTWPPNANTRAIVISTTKEGVTNNMTFRDISSHGLAGAAVTVLGAAKVGSDREIERFAKNITIQNCTLERTGKFMWDWILVANHGMAGRVQRSTTNNHSKVFRNDLVRSELRIEANDDRVFVDNESPLPVSVKRTGVEADRGYDSVCLFGSDLPKNIAKGRQRSCR